MSAAQEPFLRGDAALLELALGVHVHCTTAAPGTAWMRIWMQSGATDCRRRKNGDAALRRAAHLCSASRRDGSLSERINHVLQTAPDMFADGRCSPILVAGTDCTRDH